MQLSPVEMAGIGYFRQENCVSCHTVGGGKPKDRAGPGRRRHPQDGRLDDPAFQASRRHGARQRHAGHPVERRATEHAGRVSAEAQSRRMPKRCNRRPDFAVQGALIYQKNQCGSCHVVNGVGVKIGPAAEWPETPAHAELGRKALPQSASALARQHHAAATSFLPRKCRISLRICLCCRTKSTRRP